MRGAIFDLDGTLVDSRLDFAAMRRDLAFDPGAPILEAIAQIGDATERRRLEAIVHAHECAGADRATPYPGAHELLAALAARGIPVAIFTRNSREITLRTLARAGLDVPLVVSREDAPPKPDPAGLFLILKRWGLAPHEALFIGDYLFDLEAGRRAGVPTVLFAPIEPDFDHDHAEVVTSLAELAKFFR